MSRFIKQASVALQRSEREIQSLIEEASRERRYHVVPGLAHAAHRVAEILMELDHADSAAADESPRSCGTARTSDPGASTGKRTRPQRSTSAGAKPERVAPPDADYPRFLREDNALIKVGSSKTSESTYEHRAPKSVLDIIVKRAIGLTDKNRRPFTAEALSDVRGHHDDQQVPGYQLYLCLAWLKRSGLIKQHGRKGYSLINSSSVVSDVEDAWNALGEDRS